MKLVALRGEDAPADVIAVIRGGAKSLTKDAVTRSARRNQKAFGFLGISVFLALDQSVEELCADVDELRRYGQIRLSTAGRVRAAGFALLATGGRPHFDVILPDLSDDTLGRLEAAFDPPRLNPARER